MVVHFKVPNDNIAYLPRDGPFSVGDRCQTDAYLYVADGWDFERVFSLEDPRGLPDYGPRRAVGLMLEHVVTPAMSRGMVAFAIGYPARFGTVRELNKRPVWDHYAGPEAIEVSFYGHVVTQVIQGEVP
jgi:hypothetical protein